MEQEFLALVKEHNSAIHHACNTYARTLEREDMVQEILAAAWEGFPKFKGTSPFGVWFYGLCRNVCVHHLRKHVKRMGAVMVSTEIEEQIPYEDYSQEQAELCRFYELTLGTLPHIEKRYMQMYLGDLSFKQMQQITGVDENTLRVRIHRIKKRLRCKYGKK